MSLPLRRLQPISTSNYFTSGDITIEDGVAIAPGVLLHADPDSQVIIKTGACIGVGSVLHAHAGRVEVGEQANIGAGVLLIGQVMIGANACIGSETTIFNGTILANEVVPPGSLIGDTSRQSEALQVTDTVTYPAPNEPPNGMQAATTAALPEAERSVTGKLAEPANVNVYGKVYVNQLLVKMFPNVQRLNNLTPPLEQSPAADPWDND